MLSKATPYLSRQIAIIGLSVFASCGFTPVYAPDGVGLVLQNAVEITAPDTVMGAGLRGHLRDRLGTVSSSRFALSTTLKVSRRAATITTDGDTSRLDIIGTAEWTLTEIDTNSIRSGKAITFTSYSATGSTVATQTAEADAEARLAKALADLIAARLIVVAADFNQ